MYIYNKTNKIQINNVTVPVALPVAVPVAVPVKCLPPLLLYNAGGIYCPLLLLRPPASVRRNKQSHYIYHHHLPIHPTIHHINTGRKQPPFPHPISVFLGVDESRTASRTGHYSLCSAQYRESNQCFCKQVWTNSEVLYLRVPFGTLATVCLAW